MKYLAYGFLVVIGSTFALPQPEAEIETRNERFVVENQIRRAIEDLSRTIRALGWDPLEIEREEYRFVPMPLVVEIRAFIENLEFIGASNIVINRVDYSLITNRLRLDLSLPQLRLRVGDAGMTARILENRYEGKARGSLEIRQIRANADVRVNVGIISGISIRSLSLDFSVGSIQSDITIAAFDLDLSNNVNTLLNVRIPNFLNEFKDDINDFLGNALRDLLNGIL